MYWESNDTCDLLKSNIDCIFANVPFKPAAMGVTSGQWVIVDKFTRLFY